MKLVNQICLPLLYLCHLVSEKELQKLYKNFTKIDRDNSGTLEPEEFFDIPGRYSLFVSSGLSSDLNAIY